MRLLDKVFSSEKPAHNEAIKGIERDFNLRVVDREARLRRNQIMALRDALSTIFSYYGISSSEMPSGIKIVIKKSISDSENRKNSIKGAFIHESNEIWLLSTDLSSLVHEFIHAVDFNFRNQRKGERASCINEDEKAFMRFLKASGVPSHEIADFRRTFAEMDDMAEGNAYLSRPSEKLARMGAYSFWKDNESICETNPFLRFFPVSYKTNEQSEFGRSLCMFPFHRIDAIRQFVHHAAREEAGFEFAPWHPEVHEHPVMNHESGWYEKRRNYVLDIANRYNTAIKNLNNAEYCIENIKYYHTDEDIMNMHNALEKARADLAPVEKEYQQCISFFLNEIGDKEFHERFDEIRSDCKLVLLSAYLGDCRNVASLCEEKAKEKTAKRKNIPIKDTN